MYSVTEFSPVISLSPMPPDLGGRFVADHGQMLLKAQDLETAGDLPATAEILDQLLETGHCNLPIALQFARIAENLGREGEAFQVVVRALNGPDANSPRAASSLQFAAAQLLDRLGRYDQAIAYATQANAPWAAGYDPARMERIVSGCIDLFAPAKLPAIARAANRDQTPIFIVGMPRSGSTLVEQVLASHPRVFGGGELQWINRLWHQLLGRVTGSGSLDEALARMTSADADAVGAEYLGQLKALRPTATRVIDKNLSNVMHVGLLWALFPGARVIHCRRDPLDTGISCYMTDFADVLPFTCSFQGLGHFNRQVDRLMNYWEQTLDLPILKVDYEQVIGDLEGQARKLLNFLDLPWDDRCLQFHRNKRQVITASRWQVRRPIYNSSVGRWRHYEPWLGPLREALGQ